ncbi:MAG: PQQ-like beta-propeller repeat protein [Planctomycetales bacterium]|nr:PQQ-like beta-propeller repeat protein [Planctomycetales bacterium]
MEKKSSKLRFLMWIIGALLLVWAVICYFSESGGLAIRNVTSLILAAGGVGAFILPWFWAQSRRFRWITVGVVVALLVVAASVLELRQTSGSLMPRFALRWERTPDERLNPVKPDRNAENVVDLATTSEQDFPQFLGPDRTNRVSGRGLSADWSNYPPQLKWRRSIGAGWSSFVAVNGFAVTMEQRGESEYVTCYEIATGKPRWAHRETTRHATVLGYIGPRSTPTIYDGRVYSLGATGILCCLDGATGKPVWTKNTFDLAGMSQADAERYVAWGRSCSPLIVDDKVVVSIGGADPDNLISLAAFDALTGEVIWKGANYQASYASPALITLAGERQIVVVNQDYVTGHDPNSGQVLWEFDWAGRSNANANTSQALAATDDSIFVSKGYGKGAGVYRLIRGDDGQWQSPQELWQNNSLKTKFSNVAIRDGYAYGLDDKRLSCVRVADGKKMWKQQQYGYGQTIMVDDYILVAGEMGELALVAVDPQQFRELGRVQVLNAQTWNTPCLYGRTMLLRNSEEVVCYELPGTDSTSP